MRARTLAGFVVLASLVTSSAWAQDRASRLEAAFYPSSRIIATQGSSADQPRFRTYLPSGSVMVKFTPYIGVEGEVGGSRGTAQTIGVFGRQQSPAMTAVAVTLVTNLAPRHTVQPYVAVGVGSVHMFKRPEIGLTQGETFDSAHVGGGAKVMFGRWGIRADYRYVGMDSTAIERSVFVGPGTRHAHRISVGIVLGGN